jgi:hypothetical protein
MTAQETPRSPKTTYSWQREVEAALIEGDPKTLRQRVDAAEAALFLRSQALAGSALTGSALTHPEQQAISAAVRTLRTIQRDKLGYPRLNNLNKYE